MDIASTALLLLSPVGGYFFLQQWERTRYATASHEGRKLYFQAVAWGLYLTIGLFLFLTALIFCVGHLFPEFDVQPHIASAFPISWVGDPDPKSTLNIALILSPLAGYLLAAVFNFLTSKQKHFAAALSENAFEWLIGEAIRKQSMVLVSLKDGKEYVGFIDTVRDPARGERRFFSLLPVMSGYRTATQQVEFTTFYDYIRSQLDQSQSNELDHVELYDLLTVLPVESVRSIRLFDQALFEAFQRDSAGTHKPSANTEHGSS